MKKHIALAAVLLLGASVFAMDWDVPFMIGFSMPVSKLTLENKGKIKQTAYDLDMGALFVENTIGISFKMALDMGVGVAKDMDNSIRMDTTFDVGAGWSPVHTKYVTLSAFGVAGIDYAIGSYETTTTYSSRGKDVYGYYPDKIEHKIDDSWIDWHIGFDIQGIFWFGGGSFGLYANYGYRKILGGSYSYTDNETRYGSLTGITTYKYNTSTDSYGSDIKSGSRSFYTIGICFKF